MISKVISCSGLALTDMVTLMYAFVLSEETVFLDQELLEFTPKLGECGSRNCHGGRVLDVHMWELGWDCQPWEEVDALSGVEQCQDFWNRRTNLDISEREIVSLLRSEV